MEFGRESLSFVFSIRPRPSGQLPTVDDSKELVVLTADSRVARSREPWTIFMFAQTIVDLQSQRKPGG
jgi:hypothetical protein